MLLSTSEDSVLTFISACYVSDRCSQCRGQSGGPKQRHPGMGSAFRGLHALLNGPACLRSSDSSSRDQLTVLCNTRRQLREHACRSPKPVLLNLTMMKMTFPWHSIFSKPRLADTMQLPKGRNHKRQGLRMVLQHHQHLGQLRLDRLQHQNI